MVSYKYSFVHSTKLDNQQALAHSSFLHCSLSVVKLNSDTQGNKQALDSCTTQLQETQPQQPI